jgi:FkbM family methyltransferase
VSRRKRLRVLLALLGGTIVAALGGASAIDRALSRPTLIVDDASRDEWPPAMAYFADLEKRLGKKQYSYQSEETIIRDVFEDARDGYFVDVGASHYRDLSNTYYLEKNLGWRGIGIDAQEKYAADYARYRPHTRFLVFFVGEPANSGKQTEFFVDLQCEYTSTGMDAAVRNPSKKIVVSSITLDELLVREGVSKIDFLSMDIEDAEPGALAGFSIQRWQPRLVCIEMHAVVAKAVTKYFTDNGYVRLRSYLAIDRLNGYFVRRGSPEEERERARVRSWLAKDF